MLVCYYEALLKSQAILVTGLKPGGGGAIFLQVTVVLQLFQRAVMFALVNPQPNGAGFAGVRTNLTGLGQFQDAQGFLLQVSGN